MNRMIHKTLTEFYKNLSAIILRCISEKAYWKSNNKSLPLSPTYLPHATCVIKRCVEADNYCRLSDTKVTAPHPINNTQGESSIISYYTYKSYTTVIKIYKFIKM